MRIGLVILAIVGIGLWLLLTPDGLLGKADAIGYAVCHRIDLRSFHLGERALPLCARCSGLYLGALATLFYYLVRRPRAAQFPPRYLIAVLLIFGLGYAFDGVNSYLELFPIVPNLYSPNNLLRLVTGTFFGIALASMVFPGFNRSAWVDPSEGPALPSFVDLGVLLILGGSIILAVESEISLILYPLALLSSASVLILLTMIYTMIILILFRRENLARNWKDLALPTLGGLILAVLQIGVIDVIRYSITGTWGGLPL
jgi:uncharacterized membrane protein